MATTIRDDRLGDTEDQTPVAKAAPFNIASCLSHVAAAAPDQTAVVMTQSRGQGGSRRLAGAQAGCASITFAELEALSNRYANGLSGCGFTRGMRVLVMVRPGFEFIAIAFALFKLGAVPVLIDPGMGVRRLLQCIRSTSPQGFIGIPLAHAMRVLRRRAFESVDRVVTVGRRWAWGGPTLKGLSSRASTEFTPVETSSFETAAILFTSGATGPPKGVVYEHGMFGAQVRMIQSCYGIEPGEVDLPAFAPFALFSTAMGMTSVIPDMDPTRPAKVDPAKIVEAIRDHHVTNTFGSPAIWKRVAPYCLDHGIKLPTLRRVLIAGAPVPWHVLDQMQRVLSDEADIHTPYGATESLPVASISAREVLDGCSDKTRAGAGTCVGKPLPQIEMRFIRITDEPIAQWSDGLHVPDGEIGEIVVAGDVVTKEYHGLDAATRLAKIRESDKVWHRMGDVGYRDEAGRVWFCGRKGHRVLTEAGTMFSVRCEAIFNEHPDVFRSALVGVGPPGGQTPVIVIEPKAGRFPSSRRRAAFRSELLQLGRASELTRSIERVLFHRSLPVDIRHNIKINREELAVWAARRLR